jgi:hypothetical protein
MQLSVLQSRVFTCLIIFVVVVGGGGGGVGDSLVHFLLAFALVEANPIYLFFK